MAKKLIVGIMTNLFETERLKIKKGLPFQDQLLHELATFKVKITEASNETFEAAREGGTSGHGDIVMGLGVGLFVADRCNRQLWVV